MSIIYNYNSYIGSETNFGLLGWTVCIPDRVLN